MDSSRQIAAFIAHVRELTGKFTETRSSLRNLLVYLRIPANSSRPFLNEDDIKSKCLNPRDPRLTKYGPAIKELKRVWGTSLDYRKPPLPLRSAMAFVESVKSQLEQCRLYVCNDVGTFPQCIKPKLTKEEHDRIRNIIAVPVGLPIQSPDRSWKTNSLKVAHDAVNTKKAGECTNYAYYAAHILFSNNMIHPKPRIEIVAWEGAGRAKHLFVIVGREGPTAPDGSLPAVATWNADLVIVDCWALTLGWNCIYTKNDYCFKNTMMYPLRVQMDSTLESSGLPMNLQSGLKKTGLRVSY